MYLIIAKILQEQKEEHISLGKKFLKDFVSRRDVVPTIRTTQKYWAELPDRIAELPAATISKAVLQAQASPGNCGQCTQVDLCLLSANIVAVEYEVVLTKDQFKLHLPYCVPCLLDAAQ